MAKTQIKTTFINRLARPLPRLLSFFHRLQWKLTLAYTLFTIVTTLILAGIGLALLWYLNFRSNLAPNLIAEGLVKGISVLPPYLEQTPPDREGLNEWLQSVTPGNHLIINLPTDNPEDDNETIPGQFGRVVFVAIVDPAGQVLAMTPADTAIPPEAALQAQLSPGLAEQFQVGLGGETDPSQIATRDQDGNLVATVPILGEDEQVLGAIFVKLAFPIEESEFLQNVLRGLILPIVLGMVVSGGLAGVLFGLLIARGLTRRLQALDEAANALSRGDFSVLAPDTSDDELGQLTRHFNHMAIQLQSLLQTHQELAAMEERNRLARDLHDSVKQQVFATVMQVGAARALLPENPTAAQTHLTEAEHLAHQAQQELTTLIQELRPAALAGKGLATALRDYVADWSQRTNIAAEVRVRGERPLTLTMEQTLFRVAQEALTNVTRHSQATTTEVDLAWQGDEVTLTISDDGQGFNIKATNNGQGLGLQSMRERIETLGGYLTVESKPGAGTRITARCKGSVR